MLNAKHNTSYLGLAAVIVVADQAVKWLVRSSMAYRDEIPVFDFFSIVRWHNDGAAFSMLGGLGGRWFFVALALGFTVFILFEIRRLPVNDWLMRLVFALILGGALGNMFDRLFLGYVVDFILVHYRDVWYFPAFNIADSALNVGAALWIGSMLVEYRRSRQRKRSPVEPQ